MSKKICLRIPEDLDKELNNILDKYPRKTFPNKTVLILHLIKNGFTILNQRSGNICLSCNEESTKCICGIK